MAADFHDQGGCDSAVVGAQAYGQEDRLTLLQDLNQTLDKDFTLFTTRRTEYRAIWPNNNYETHAQSCDDRIRLTPAVMLRFRGALTDVRRRTRQGPSGTNPCSTSRRGSTRRSSSKYRRGIWTV